MDAIARGLVRVGAYLLFRHQSALGVVAWLLVLLLVGSVAYLVVGWFITGDRTSKVVTRRASPAPSRGGSVYGADERDDLHRSFDDLHSYRPTDRTVHRRLNVVGARLEFEVPR